MVIASMMDIPHVVDMTYASPDTWHNLLPKVELYEQLPVTIPGSNRGSASTTAADLPCGCPAAIIAVI